MITIDTGSKPKEVLAAKGRWALVSADFSGLELYTTHVDLDLLNKELLLHVLDAHLDGVPVVDGWVLDLINGGEDMLTLKQFDGEGNLIGQRVFGDLRLIGHRSPRNYEGDNDTYAEHEILFQYGIYETEKV